MAIATGKGEAVRERMQARLDVLKTELEKGQAELQKVESQRAYLRETMLRIEGAIQVLEEVLAEEKPAGHNGAVDPGEAQPSAARAEERSV